MLMLLLFWNTLHHNEDVSLCPVRAVWTSSMFKSVNLAVGAVRSEREWKGGSINLSVKSDARTEALKELPTRLTASFQWSRRDGRVRWLVFMQGRLAYAGVTAKRINVIVAALAGAEGLDVVPGGDRSYLTVSFFMTIPHLLPVSPSKYPFPTPAVPFHWINSVFAALLTAPLTLPVSPRTKRL